MSKEARTKTRVVQLGGDLGIKDLVNNEILLFKYSIQAKGADATPANHAFSKRIADTDQSNPERLFNPFFRLPGKFLSGYVSSLP
jgi:hypothetical protein